MPATAIQAVKEAVPTRDSAPETARGHCTNVPRTPFKLPGLEASTVALERGAPKFDLTLTARDEGPYGTSLGHTIAGCQNCNEG